MPEETVKPALASKTIHFNWISAAVWPFLPRTFRDMPGAELALVAWFSLGNIALRIITKSAVSFAFKPRSKNEKA